ncbi:MAG: hypothetical protein CL920_02650 [Deltaproteobacteria bacterium]|nr:hypothetical protein [Deltaproteobacteria bacterium]
MIEHAISDITQNSGERFQSTMHFGCRLDALQSKLATFVECGALDTGLMCDLCCIKVFNPLDLVRFIHPKVLQPLQIIFERVCSFFTLTRSGNTGQSWKGFVIE